MKYQKAIVSLTVFFCGAAPCLAIGPYTKNGDTVYDQATGLTWMQQTANTNNDNLIDLGDTVNWQEALSYCEGLTLGGNSDWRMPNIRELKSLVNHRSSLSSVIDPIFQYQSAYAACYYWSSTTYWSSITSGEEQKGQKKQARTICFGNGLPDFQEKISNRYVRCVRGGNASGATDSNRIVYARKRDDNEEIYSMSSEGLTDRNLTNATSSTDCTPSYSPDQKDVVFASNRTGNFDIYTMPAAGSSAPVNITNNSKDDGWPVWSPKGDKILFLSNREKVDDNQEEDGIVKRNIHLMDTDGRNVARITFGYDVSHAAWSPDASRIVFVSAGEIYFVSLSTGIITKLTANSYYDDYPSWSPDNKYILYSSEQISGSPNKLDLFMIDIFSKSTRVIMDSEFDIRYPAWLPDGRIVFTIATEYGQNSTREIYITKRKVFFDSTLTLSDLILLTSNIFEDNHPMVAMPITGKQAVPDIIAPLLLRMK